MLEDAGPDFQSHGPVLTIATQRKPIQASGHETARWAARGKPFRSVFTALVGLFGIVAAVALLGYHHYPHPPNDFYAFHSFSRFIHEHRPALIYDQTMLRQFQSMPNKQLYAYMYHPGMMLLVWPLQWFAYDAGYVSWVGIGLASYLAAVWNGDRLTTFVALVAPSTLWTILCGQSSLLVAALLIGGLSLTKRQPVAAGILLGVATYKPQLGLLVPIALIAAGQWRTMAAAFGTFLCIVVVSSLLFGTTIWLVWLDHLPSILRVESANSRSWASVLATVTSNLRMFGVGRTTTSIVQPMVSIVVAWHVWSCFRRGCGALEIATLAVATFLATPFAFTYDMPLCTAGILLFVDERRRTHGLFGFAEIMVIVASLLLPYCVVTEWLHRLGSLVLFTLVCMIARRIGQVRPHGPGEATIQAAATA